MQEETENMTRRRGSGRPSSDAIAAGEMRHRLLCLCTAAGIPSNALGLCAHITACRMQDIYNGDSPTLGELRRMAAAFGVDVATITGRPWIGERGDLWKK